MSTVDFFKKTKSSSMLVIQALTLCLEKITTKNIDDKKWQSKQTSFFWISTILRKSMISPGKMEEVKDKKTKRKSRTFRSLSRNVPVLSYPVPPAKNKTEKLTMTNIFVDRNELRNISSPSFFLPIGIQFSEQLSVMSSKNTSLFRFVTALSFYAVSRVDRFRRFRDVCVSENFSVRLEANKETLTSC